MTKICFAFIRALASATISVAVLFSSPLAHADGLQDINKLIKQKQYPQALEQINTYLAPRPKDAQGRFLKGVVLTEMNKSAEAIVVFTRLTEDYPELPEPWNNLAVIHAQQKQYDKARQALEMAIRTHPSYATSHENLGDIYARLASQAYDKALQIDSSNASAQHKLALIRELISVSGNTEQSKPAASRAAEPVKPAPAPVAGTPVAAEATPPGAAPQPATEAQSASPTQTASTAVTTSAEVSKAVDAWRSAWSRKDVKAYLAAYAGTFQTPGGIPRSAWETERRQRITKPGAISVSLENLRIEIKGDTAIARFRQNYQSGNLKTKSNKVLHLLRQNGQWLIEQERIGN
ncbi:MAG: DUF4440 domain-containing protein [Betaproteobacteria bacterium HGW-Betaproteobacteria-11]|nr:MAG: DUF4440 domain-containing protein [Betaproteobacteria bacterium HGW-Betaproteobacteria-11]